MMMELSAIVFFLRSQNGARGDKQRVNFGIGTMLQNEQEIA